MIKQAKSPARRNENFTHRLLATYVISTGAVVAFEQTLMLLRHEQRRSRERRIGERREPVKTRGFFADSLQLPTSPLLDVPQRTRAYSQAGPLAFQFVGEERETTNLRGVDGSPVQQAHNTTGLRTTTT